ncbi:DMT family transporter [Halobacillus yeomjeoni]|nr:EamA family transporter [Halobacillus yeomjeoni]
MKVGLHMKLYAALISLSMIWGLSFVFIKVLVDPAGVWGTVFLRCIAGALILLPFLWWQRKHLVRPLPWKSLGVVGIFNAGLPWGLIALSETTINSSTAAVLNALTPVCTALIGYLFFSIVLSKKQWAGVGIGFIGIVVIMDFNVDDILGQGFIGIGTMILATACYGFASQYTKRHLQNAGVLLVTTVSLLVGAAVGGVGMLITQNPIPSEAFFSPMIWVSIIGLGCFGSGIAHLLFYYMIEKGSAEFATSVTYLIPLTAMVWGSVLLGETLTRNLTMGLVMIFVGIYLSNRKSQPLQKPWKTSKAG